jgi:hypothetical protein
MHRQKSILAAAWMAALLILSLSCSTLASGQDAAVQTDTGESESGPAGTVPSATPRGDAGAAETPAEPTPEPGVVGGNPEYLGDYQSADGYFFAAIEVADPAAPAVLYEKQEGMRLVGVRLVVGNQAGERLYFSISDVAVEDSGGDLWESEFAAVEDEIASAYIDRGERVRGWLGFTLPEDRQAVKLVCLYDYVDEKSVVLPLTEPPAGRPPVLTDSARTPRTDSQLGRAAEGSGFSLTAFRVEDPGEPAFPGLFDAPAGTHLVSVEIEVGNTGDEARVFTSFEISLVDSDGFLYAIDYLIGPETIESGELEPGGSFRGWVSFVVPDGSEPESIKFYSVLMDEPLYAGLAE